MTVITTLFKLNLDGIKATALALQEIWIDLNLAYTIGTLCVIVSVLLVVFPGIKKNLGRFMANFLALLLLILLGIIYVHFAGESNPLSEVLLAAVPLSVVEAQSPSSSDYDSSSEGESSEEEPFSQKDVDKLIVENHEKMVERDRYENAGRLLDEDPETADGVLRNHGLNPETEKDSLKSEVQDGLRDTTESLKEVFLEKLDAESVEEAIADLEKHNTDVLDIDEAKKDLSTIIENRGL